jgi:signal transduction histidine kinase
LASSLDYTATLANLATLLVPRITDGFVVDLVGERGEIRRVAAVDDDPAKAPVMAKLMHLGPVNPSAPEGIQRLLEQGRSFVSEQVTEEALRRGARDEEHLRLLVSLEARSMMMAPLRARGRSIGLLWLYYSRSKRSFRAADLSFLEEIAARADGVLRLSPQTRVLDREGRARDEFLSLASHELRTPLTSMLLRVQGELRHMQRDAAYAPSRSELEAWLKSFHQQAGKLERLIEAMLDVSRMTGSGTDLEREHVDLGKTVADTARSLTEDARKAGSRLEVDAPEGIVGWWDPSRVRQVVAALVSNAVKYGEGKPILVRVSREGDRGRVAVTDHGMGIAEEHRERIFGRFERIVSPRNYGGFGIGLWIARRLVEASGGSIHVESEPGQGSTFRVELPLATP